MDVIFHKSTRCTVDCSWSFCSWQMVVPKWYQSGTNPKHIIFSSCVSSSVSISPVRPQRPQANPQPTGTQWWAKDMTSEHVRNTRYGIGIWNSWAVVFFCISMYFDLSSFVFGLWSLAVAKTWRLQSLLLWGHHMKAPNSPVTGTFDEFNVRIPRESSQDFPFGGRADAGAARLEARDRMETQSP